MNLRESISTDVFDFLQLQDVLSGYSQVRDRIKRLLASGEIIRLKKGLYTFPEYLRRQPLNPCVLSNMLYGPSYVSADYMLSRYGMIPERVECVTAMTQGRSRSFQTPVGCFSYAMNTSDSYIVGIRLEDAEQGGVLLADPAKALYDKVLTDSRFDGEEIGAYLFQDLRIEPDTLKHLNVATLRALESCSRGRMLLLVKFLRGYLR